VATELSDKKIKILEQSIVNKVIQAYGGNQLLSAKSIVISEHNKYFSSGQGASPDQPGVFNISEVLTIDFVGKRKSVLSWRVSRTSKDLDKFVYDGKNGRIYDILNNKYSEETWLNFATTGSSIVRKSDTMIARSLSSSETKLRYQGQSWYLGALHQQLNVKIGSAKEYTLYVNKSSGLISKMSRQHPSAGEISYAFSNYAQSSGVTFSRDMLYTVAGKTQGVSVSRNIELNVAVDEIFSKPAEYSTWGEVFDSSELRLNKVAENVYHVGKGRSFTLFVDTGEYFIAAGGHNGIAERFKAIKDAEKIDKPLKYMISTHHHNEHLPALKEAVALGAKIITVKEHQQAIQKTLANNSANDVFTLVNEQASFGDGAVEIYDIATMHADNYLLIYLPKVNVIFAEDHFETQLKTAMPRVHKDMVIFSDKVDALKLDVQLLLDGHSPRQLLMQEFTEAINTYQNRTCPKGYSICARG